MEKTFGKDLLRYKDPAGQLQKINVWRKANPHRIKESNYRGNIKIKTEALAHYGVAGIAVCCWEGCAIQDLDMLTLDHVNNDGAAHRGERGRGTGAAMYRKLRLLNWPEGFQTLCWNHQWKKEITRRRDLGYYEKRFA